MHCRPSNKSFGYYPYLYASRFVSGMIGLDSLELRRKLLLLVHFYQMLHNTVTNPTVLSRMGLHVPTLRPLPEGMEALPPRRRCRLFAAPSARTRRAGNAPTARALALFNEMAVDRQDIDVFADSVGGFCRKCIEFLNVVLNV